MDVSPALLVDRVTQMEKNQNAQEGVLLVAKKAMDMQASAAQALLNSVAGDLPLAGAGMVGTRLNTLV